MDGRRAAGRRRGPLTTVVHPVRLAHAVMDDGRHVLLAASGAEAFAREHGLETAAPEHFLTPRQVERWKRRVAATMERSGPWPSMRRGHLAAATSTGGISGKLPGRIGDSAVIGAGTYADDRAGAASATGNGDRILSVGLARRAVDLLRDGLDPNLAAHRALSEIGAIGGGAGLILVDRFGRTAWAFDTEEMTVAIRPCRAQSLDGILRGLAVSVVFSASASSLFPKQPQRPERGGDPDGKEAVRQSGGQGEAGDQGKGRRAEEEPGSDEARRE